MGFGERIGEGYRVDYNTPEIIRDLVLIFEPEGIDLDPCSNPRSIMGARVEWMLERGENGLKQTWSGYGLVYVNPPYGRAIVPFVDAMMTEAAMGAEIIALVPARVDTKWFQKLHRASNSVCFWSGRLTFGGADQPAMFPSAVVYFGPRRALFNAVFGRFGLISSTVNSSTETRP